MESNPEQNLTPELPETDVSDLLLQVDNGEISVLYGILMGLSSEISLPQNTLKIDLDLTGIEDKKILERITFEVKILLESQKTRDKFSSVHLKIKRSQMNANIINYRMAFPSKYEVIEDEQTSSNYVIP